VQHRYFEHLYREICVALGRRIDRYGLWLGVWESGGDPGDLTRLQARRFVESGLGPLLRKEGARLPHRSQRRLVTRILRFDPRFPTPEECLEGPHSDGPTAP
jgi:hypothetical protein